MKYLILLSLVASGCSMVNPYKPMELSCKTDKLQVLEYTRVCSRESYNTWQSCSAQAERLFCKYPVWNQKKEAN